MKLSQPQAYGAIKPLHGSTGRPIRCTPSHVVIPEIEDRPDCANCLPAKVRFAGSGAFCDVSCCQCDKPREPTERTKR